MSKHNPLYRDPAWQLRRRINRVWAAMIQRCTDPRADSYRYYGARGIAVDPVWKTFEPFHEWAMAAGYRPGLTLDRIDGDKHYSPGNCRWATPIQQANNKRGNHRLTHRGNTLTIAEWSREIGLSEAAIERRLNLLRWSVERTLDTPRRGWGPGKPRVANAIG